MKKIEFKKELKGLYSAGPSITEVDAGTGTFLAVKGQGEPGGESFQAAVQDLFGLAYTLKFSLKNQGVLDFAVSPLEALYYDDPKDTPMKEWRWRMMIRIPEQVTESQVNDAATEIRIKKNRDVSGVKKLQLKEGRSLQVLHVGPYQDVGKIYHLLTEHIRENEQTVTGVPHEIYISDPRRTAPERLKTIIRIPIE